MAIETVVHSVPKHPPMAHIRYQAEPVVHTQIALSEMACEISATLQVVRSRIDQLESKVKSREHSDELNLLHGVVSQCIGSIDRLGTILHDGDVEFSAARS